MNEERKVAGIYIRVSTEEQVMEMTEKVQSMFVYEMLYNIYFFINN